jgi:hypothetical protein
MCELCLVGLVVMGSAALSFKQFRAVVVAKFKEDNKQLARIFSGK